MVSSHFLECFYFYFLVLLLLYCTSCILGTMDDAPLTIDYLDLEIYDIEFVQTGAGATETIGTSTATGAIKTAGTSGGASSHPFDSQSHLHPFIFSRKGSISVVYSLETTLGPFIVTV